MVHSEEFATACDYYGLKPFVPEQGKDKWEERFLKDVKQKMTKGTILSENQVQKLWEILDGDGKVEPATQRQKDYLIRLGFEGDLDEISKHDASTWIKKLKNKGKSDWL